MTAAESSDPVMPVYHNTGTWYFIFMQVNNSVYMLLLKFNLVAVSPCNNNKFEPDQQTKYHTKMEEISALIIFFNQSCSLPQGFTILGILKFYMQQLKNKQKNTDTWHAFQEQIFIQSVTSDLVSDILQCISKPCEIRCSKFQSEVLLL